MTKLDKLIEKLCPKGIEYKPLWSLTAWDKKFNGIDKNKQIKIISYKYYLSVDFDKVERQNGDIKYISTGISGNDRYTTEELAKDYVAEGEIVCIPWGGTPNVKYHKGKFVTGDNRIATSLDTNILNNRFLYYWMQSKIETIASFYRGSGIKHPSMKNILDMCIPVPPLEVQHEIVHILDRFTELSTELTTQLSAELKARQKQYNYFENQLLNKAYKVVKLGDICDICAGGTPSKTKSEYWNNGTIKWLGSTVCKNKKYVDEVTGYITELGLKNSSAKLMRKKTTLIGMVGATIGKVSFLDFEAATNQNIACLYPKNNTELNPDYLYYACKNLYPIFLEFANGKFTIASLSFIKSLEISLPSYEEQEKIVNRLERLDRLCNDTLESLPAEIEARKKQYEYYRNKLLTFKELKINE